MSRLDAIRSAYLAAVSAWEVDDPTDVRQLDDDRSELPGVAGEIAEIIGRESTLFLLSRLGHAGNSGRLALYVPKRMPADHWLVALLGWRDAEALRRHFGGEILQPPKCRILVHHWRRRRAAVLAALGINIRAIAADIGVGPRQARNILVEHYRSLAETPPEEIAKRPCNHRSKAGHDRSEVRA